MPRAKSILSASVGIALLAGLGWSGREAGKRMARAGWFLGAAAERREPAAAAPVRTATVEKTAGNPDIVHHALRRLLFLTEGSGGFTWGDWESIAEIQSILGALSATDLAALHAALLVHPAGRDPFAVGSSFLLGEILSAWIRLDPAAALRASFAHRRYYGGEPFSAWAQDDPAAAFDWLGSDDFPSDLAGMRDAIRASALHSLLHRDFERATAEFLLLPPGQAGGMERSAVISGWASSASGDPAQRERLIAFAKSTGNPGDHAAMNRSLLRDWPQEDALGMLTYLHELRDYLETADFPADQRPALEATAVGAAIYREYDGPALEWWMERHADQSEVPDSLRHAMTEWRQKYPDKVNQWFAGQPDSPQRDALQASLVPSLIATGNMDDAAQVIGQIGNPDLRQPAIERLDYVWSKRDAAAAAAWRESLSR